MTGSLIVIFLTVATGLGLIYLLIKSQLDVLSRWLQSMQQTVQSSDKNVTDTLQQSYQQLNQRLDAATRVISELKTETGKFSEIGHSMQNLQAFLTSPKLRGGLGEQILADLLSQVLPKESFSLQYRFHTGDIVDAVIRTQSGIIPIDSKFPLENFKLIQDPKNKSLFVSDVKKHLKAISQKYIRTEEGTLDFALMYIPSESVYYEITANIPELQTHAQELRVLPVSPSTFYAFLRTILVSFEGARIAHEAQTILRSLKDIQKSTLDFGDHLSLLSKHLTNAYNNMNIINTEYSQLQGKINSTSALPSPEKPILEE